MYSKYLLFYFLLFPVFVFCQNTDRAARQADALLERKDYENALHNYQLLLRQKPGDAAILARLGICHFHLNHLSLAEQYLSGSVEAPEGAPSVAWLYLGKLYHARLDFEKAIKHYKLFLKNTTHDDPARPAVKDAIRRCARGLLVRRQRPLGQVRPLSEEVNSPAAECRPLPSPNYPDVIYFASDRRQHPHTGMASFDIFSTERTDTSCTSPMLPGLIFNTPAQEIPLGFDRAGQVLYFFRGATTFSGDILVDTFKEDVTDINIRHDSLLSPVRAWEGDCDPHFFNDSILLFASRRPGGWGGLDIYLSARTPSGWTFPKNLGPTINSPYDDRWPFLAPDGHTLYFSTNDPRRSIGGLDIMKSVFLNRVLKWTPPENLGIPFNSAADDEGFFLSENGSYALFASSRKTGRGRSDIYLGTFFSPSIVGRPGPARPATVTLATTAPRQEGASLPDNRPFVVGPVRYTNAKSPLPETSLNALRRLAILLKTYPLLKVVLVGYADRSGATTLRSVLDRAVAFLRSEGVSVYQVKWLAVARQYAPQRNTSKSIDIFAANPEVLPMPLQLEQTPATTFRSTFFRKAMNSLIFQVQIPIDPASPVNDFFDRFPDGILIKHPANGQEWLSPGFHLSWDAAVEACNDLRLSGFPQATVVPLLNGWELTPKEAARHLHEYPELAHFTDGRQGNH